MNTSWLQILKYTAVLIRTWLLPLGLLQNAKFNVGLTYKAVEVVIVVDAHRPEF
jgi:hypothetical protein